MLTDFKIPAVGENITQGVATKIFVKVGDTVKKDQNLLELETDKAVIEVPSPVDGVIKEISIKDGASVKIGQSVMKIESGAAAPAGKKEPTPVKTAAAPKAESRAAAQETAPTKTSLPKTEKTAPASAGGSIIDFKIPVVGENITSGVATKIFVKVGDTVKKDQNLLELETDKAVIEVPSPVDGVIKEISIKDGTSVKIGQSVMKIQSSSAAADAGTQKTPDPTKAAPAPKAESYAAAQEGAAAKSAPIQQEERPVAVSSSPAKDVAAAPSVRKFAREIGIDISMVPGTGPGKRISIEDVKAFAKQLNTGAIKLATSGGGQAAPRPLPDFSKWGEIERKPLSSVRLKTAEHLTHAWTTIPHVTQFDKADITELEKLRKRFSPKVEKSGAKLTITAFMLKVIASALKNFPQFNTSLDLTKNEIVHKKYYHIGVAVDTDRGLLVPVIRDVDKKNILELSVELNQIAEKARNKKITIEEMQGGTFTITNLGGIGGTAFTPIVNTPEAAILGLSRSSLEPVYMDGHFAPRLMLPLSLSYDHRLVDGADGARFIRWVAEAIQQPFMMDLEG